MPIHSIQWKAFASSLDDEELIADAMAWLCNDKDSVVIEKTTSPMISIGVIAATGLTAMILPIYLVRRWTKL